MPLTYTSKANVEEIWIITLDFALSTGGPLGKLKGLDCEGKLDKMLKKSLKYFPLGPPKYGFKWGAREGPDTREVYAF